MVQTRAAARLIKGHPLAVSRPLVKEVRDTRTGLIHDVQDIFGNDPLRAQAIRSENAGAKIRGKSLYVCPLCHSSLSVCVNVYGDHYYFQHVSGGEQCELQVRNLSEEQIRAIKYNGAKESEAHKNLKKLLVNSLSSDSKFSDVQEEKVIKSSFDSKWCKPDVSAIRDGLLVAFEAQLSTTFLDVVEKRKAFYLDNCAFLFWIFPRFDLELARMTELDVFHNNNCNAFVVDEETARISVMENRFKVRCIWPEPVVDSCEVGFIQRERILDFKDLVLVGEKQSAFYYDFSGALKEAEGQVFDMKFASVYNSASDVKDKVACASDYLEATKLEGYDVSKFVQAIESARLGHPVGWKFDNLVQVFNQLYQYMPNLVFIFSIAVRQFDHKLVCIKVDNKKKKIWEDLKAGIGGKYVPLESNINLLRVCYPNVYGEYMRLLSMLPEQCG